MTYQRSTEITEAGNVTFVIQVFKGVSNERTTEKKVLKCFHALQYIWIFPFGKPQTMFYIEKYFKDNVLFAT